MEKCNLGTTYKAFSRCEKEVNLCLMEPVTQDRLMYKTLSLQHEGTAGGREKIDSAFTDNC